MNWRNVRMRFAVIYSGERLSSITPCAYPLVSDTVHCGIDDPILRQSVRVCDPDKAISMSEGKSHYCLNHILFYSFLTLP
uniref:Uncharacterized protein n=1 Tax=Parascaris equorum TaxID=6256 RepID=A0A914RCR7_PAREQ